MNFSSCAASLRTHFSHARARPLCVVLTLSSIIGLVSAGAQPATTTGDAPPKAADVPAKAGENNDSVVLSEFTVTGLRASLISSQDIKQNSSDFVDAIVSQDIGKLPDNTVADALQRVTGIQVSHTGGETNGVVIRGLPNIETTINGYEVFTGTGRGVALQDIPAEMLASLDVYKSVGADKIEGGVAGLIDIRLHRPFDFKEGLTFAFNARDYESNQSKKNSYNLSALVSDRWSTPSGEFGVLIDVSDSKQKYEDQVADNYVHFEAPFDQATDASGKQGYFADNYGFQLIPGDRIRPAASVVLQWRNKSGLELYWDNLVTGYKNDHNVNFFIAIPSFGGTRTNVVLYPQGAGGYEPADNANALFVQSLTANNTNTITSKQSFHDTTDTYQGAFGGKWEFERVKFDAEISYNLTTFKTRGVILDTIIVTPTMNVKYNQNAPSTISLTGIDYTNPANFHLSQYFDQWDRDHSVQYALKTDALIQFNGSFFKSIQAGLRYAERDVNSRSANPGSHGLPFADLASSIPGLGSLSSSTPFVSASDLNIRQWYSADENFLLKNTDTLRALAGQPLGLPAPDPSRVFSDNEKDFAPYVETNYKTLIGDLPFDGVIGFRLPHSDDSLSGFERQTVGGTSTGAFVRTTVDKERWDFLPSLNGRLGLKDDLFLRAAFTKTITRPDFASLNPATSLTSPGPTLPGSGTGGNPDLDPIRSTNYDLALEYYPSKSSQATLTGFYRSIDGYIQNYANNEVIGGNTYSVTRPRSTHNGYLEGMEVGYQQFFDFLPDALRGFGVQANYTYIKGETQSPITTLQEPIAQVSKNNYNIVLIYERGRFSGRLAYNWRDKFIDSFNQPGIQPTTVWVQPLDRLDFSASFDVTKSLTITFDATNILGSKYHDNFGDISIFTRDVRSYDRTYGAGIRYRF